MDSVGLQSSQPSVEDVERGAMRFRLLESSMENLKINQQNQSTIHNPVRLTLVLLMDAIDVIFNGAQPVDI